MTKNSYNLRHKKNGSARAFSRLLTAVSGVVLCAGGAATPVMAQSIDYSTMEEIFGEPVTTSATGKPQRMSDVPVTMEILTQEDIRRSGAVDLAEVLRQVNGVNVVQKTTQQYDVSIRGYNQHNAQRLLVLVNGRQVYLDHYGYTEWATIPVQLEEIRQIEVVKGPNTALFGFNAVNGVINIVTYNPLYDDRDVAGARVGSQNYRQGYYIQTFKPSEEFAFRVSAGATKADRFRTSVNLSPSLESGNTQSGFNGNVRDVANLDAMWQVTGWAQIRAEVSASNVHMGRTSSLGDLMKSEYETKSAKLSYEADTSYGLIKANIYKNFLDWDYRFSVLGGKSRVDQSVLVAQLEDTYQINSKHTVRGQLEFRSNEMDSPALMHDDAEISYKVYAASGMWNWKINDALSWTNAVRVDYLDLEHNGAFSAAMPYTEREYDTADLTEFSYNSGLHWRPTKIDTIRVSTARGLEVPSLLEFGIDIDGFFDLEGSPYLDPAVVTNYEIAWDRKLDSIDGGLRSAVFYNKTKDVKALFVNAGGLDFYSNNVGSSQSYGFEVELNGKIKEKFDWGVGYIYQQINDKLRDYYAPTGSYDDHSIAYPKEYDAGNPVHQVNLKLGYKEGPWEADAHAYYVSRTDQFSIRSVYQLEKVDSYIGLNARLGYTFDNDITVAAHGQQLLESDVQTSVTPDVERRFFFTVSKKF